MPICERCMKDVGKDGAQTEDGLWLCRFHSNTKEDYERMAGGIGRGKKGQAKFIVAKNVRTGKGWQPSGRLILFIVGLGVFLLGFWLVHVSHKANVDAVRKELREMERDNANALDRERYNAQRAEDSRRVDEACRRSQILYEVREAQRQQQLRENQEEEIRRRERLERGW